VWASRIAVATVAGLLIAACGGNSGPGTLDLRADGPCIGRLLPDSYLFHVTVDRANGRLVTTRVLPLEGRLTLALAGGSYDLQIIGGLAGATLTNEKPASYRVRISDGERTVLHVPSQCDPSVNHL
jgi:hypothetical protein